MKAIILAGGYAKRLFPLTKETPKPLLKVGDKEIISHIIEKIENINDIDELIISTNAKFEDKFNQYIQKLNCSKKIRLVAEPTMAEGEKLGSIGGLNFLIDTIGLNDDVLIIGGDNMFEFDIKKFISDYQTNDRTMIALKEIMDMELIKQYGVCKLGNDNQISEFHEKPQMPVSNYASTACYMFKINDLMLIKQYLAEKNSPDAMGNFISWLIKNTSVNGFVFQEDWFDIGSFESLEEARTKYSSMIN